MRLVDRALLTRVNNRTPRGVERGTVSGMEVNALPKYDMSDNPTRCCPRFEPQPWDNQELHFKDKRFVKAKTRNVGHIPLNMGRVFKRTFQAIEEAGAHSDEDFVVLSHDPSAWSGEHYFSVTKDVPGQEVFYLTGDYITRVFEGPYKEAPIWQREMEQTAEAQGGRAKKTYFFYTTCPKCAKHYGKNYVVAVTQL